MQPSKAQLDFYLFYFFPPFSKSEIYLLIIYQACVTDKTDEMLIEIWFWIYCYPQ